MKNLSVVLSALALVGVIILFGMKMSDKKTGTTPTQTEKKELTSTEGRIAHVNIDTLEANYEYLKTKRADFEARKEGMSKELERSQKQFEQDYMAAQRKVEARTMTEAEYQTTAKRLQQMEQSLKAREASLTEKLLKEQDDFNKDLQGRLDKFLTEYNKDKGYDYILSHSKAVGFIMLSNDQLDITTDVIKGMNEEYKKEGGATAKEENKKNK